MTDTEKRRLVITVGTSLFSSASWKAEEWINTHVTGYSEWTTEDYLEEPGLRRTEGWRVARRLEEELAKAPNEIFQPFDWDPDQPLRYSGELTTLLRLYRKEAEGAQDVGEFLRQRYETVDLVCPTSSKDPARIAAEHLLRFFRDELGHPACDLREVLRSEHLQELIEQFTDYLQSLSGPVDLLVTGGYKAFALQAGLMTAARARQDWRLLYLHESQLGQLVIARGKPDGTWQQETATGVTTGLQFRTPSPVGEF